jgi:selenocysteine lyase/cysteine desulfurase
MRLDVERAIWDTPGCRRVTHLNNAGAALPPSQVTEAVVAHVRREARIGGYEAEAEAADLVDRTYRALAELIGCRPDEIAMAENATRAWDMAFYALRFSSGDRILTGRSEYASNMIAFLQVAARTGAKVEVVDDDEHGQIDVEDLRRRLDSDVVLIALTHVPTTGGLVNPAAEVGAVARAAGVPYLLDACQSVGQLPVDVRELGCDILSAPGRKFLRGPRGTGFLYVSSRLAERLEPPFLDLRAATMTGPDQYVVQPGARRFETWEGNVAARIGLGVAVDYALSWGMDAISERVGGLAETLRGMLRERPGVTVHDRGVRRCGIVTFSVAGVPAADVQRRLAADRINTTVARVEHGLLDLGGRDLPDLVRASPHYYNTEDDLQRLCAALPTR